MTKDEQKTLNGQLIASARANNISQIKILLKDGADADCTDSGGWTPLTIAALQGCAEAVDILLKAGADTSIVVRDYTAEQWAGVKGYRSIANAIKNYIPETADIISLYTQISNRTLEEVFNFVTLERISLIRDGKRGPVEAAFSKNFSELENEASLGKAFNEHRRRGGKVAENVVFPHRLAKSGLTLKAQTAPKGKKP